MYYNARYYDPYLNRFISADTIVPGPGDPQAFNRYSYSLSNPVRYTDPTGHRPAEDEPPPVTIDDQNGLCVNVWNIGCSGTTESNIKAVRRNVSMLDYELFDRRIKNPAYMNDVSTIATDFALRASTLGGGLEAGLAIIGGVAGGPAGLLEGFAVGNAMHQLLVNPIESTLSLVATGAAITSDVYAGNTDIDFQNGSLVVDVGENTATALVTQVAGNVPIGIIDSAIDTYSSAYGHGESPGVLESAGWRGQTWSSKYITLNWK